MLWQLTTRTLVRAQPRLLQQQARFLSSTPAAFRQVPSYVQGPWQWEELSRTERTLFEQYGENMLSRASVQQRQKVERQLETRAKAAAALEETYGPDWHTVMKLANAIRDQERSRAESGFTERRQQLLQLLRAGASPREKRAAEEELKAINSDKRRISLEINAPERRDGYRERARQHLAQQ